MNYHKARLFETAAIKVN